MNWRRKLLFLLLLTLVVGAEEAPVIRRATQLAARDGQVVRVQGLYESYFLVRGEDLVRLRLEDGRTVLQLGPRAKAERELLNNRTVQALGKLDTHGPPPPTGEPFPQILLTDITEVKPYP